MEAQRINVDKLELVLNYPTSTRDIIRPRGWDSDILKLVLELQEGVTLEMLTYHLFLDMQSDWLEDNNGDELHTDENDVMWLKSKGKILFEADDVPDMSDARRVVLAFIEKHDAIWVTEEEEEAFSPHTDLIKELQLLADTNKNAAIYITPLLEYMNEDE